LLSIDVRLNLARDKLTISIDYLVSLNGYLTGGNSSQTVYSGAPLSIPDTPSTGLGGCCRFFCNFVGEAGKILRQLLVARGSFGPIVGRAQPTRTRKVIRAITS